MAQQKSFDALEMKDIKKNNDKPSSAPAARLELPSNDSTKSELFRRSTGSKKRRRPSRMSSSSSLHSLVSILKPSASDQRSAPNVSFSSEYNNIGISKNSISVNMNPSMGETSSQFAMDGEVSLRAAGGSFSTQTSTIGFRSSFFSVLEKLGVLRSQDLYKASQNSSEQKFQSERKRRSSIASLYFRALYGGKYIQDMKAQTISIATCCKAQCHLSPELR